MSRDLVMIAERALKDQLEAEQLVAGLCRLQAGLVTTATHSAMPSQRDAARAELERLVRRAVLDALPPLIAKPSTAPGRPTSSTAAPTSRKRVEPASGKAAGRAARPTLAPPPPPIAAAPPRPSEPAPGAPHRRSAGQPTGLADLPSTATAVGAETQHRGRKLALTAVAVAVLLGGLGFSYFAYAPEDANGPDLARQPTSSPQLAAPPAEPDPPSTTELSLESLQLEAVETSTGPLRDRDGLTEPTSPAPPQQAAALESDLRIVLLYQSNSTAAARAGELRTTLATFEDPPEIELRSVGFTITTPRIRYFYTDDAASAAALADLFAPPTTGTWQVQDFTHLRPSPTQGTLEVFIPITGS